MYFKACIQVSGVDRKMLCELIEVHDRTLDYWTHKGVSKAGKIMLQNVGFNLGWIEKPDIAELIKWGKSINGLKRVDHA